MTIAELIAEVADMELKLRVPLELGALNSKLVTKKGRITGLKFAETDEEGPMIVLMD
jgi:hypothetical protein